MSILKIVANWKMNGSKEEITNWLKVFKNNVDLNNQPSCIFCPPACYLDYAHKIILDNNLALNLGSQNLNPDQEYPSTGGINGQMLKDLGCNHVIVGHSERRIHFQEDEDNLVKQLSEGIQNKLNVVYCVGETREDRDSGLAKEIIKKQLTTLRGFPFHLISIAYEPIWSIGKDTTPSLNSIDEMHQTIKDELKLVFKTEENITVSYGGSVSTNNAVSISELNSVDGLLIGGASLDANSFSEVVNKITR